MVVDLIFLWVEMARSESRGSATNSFTLSLVTSFGLHDDQFLYQCWEFEVVPYWWFCGITAINPCGGVLCLGMVCGHRKFCGWFVGKRWDWISGCKRAKQYCGVFQKRDIFVVLVAIRNATLSKAGFFEILFQCSQKADERISRFGRRDGRWEESPNSQGKSTEYPI